MSRIVKKGGFKRATALAASLLCAFALAGCKPTDFFTDIVITPFSDTIDESNDNYLVINSPDAEAESPTVTALQWTEESPRSETVNNLVVYSSNPNTDMTAHHSLFDLEPLFPGIEASDGVRLVYDDSSSLDHEAEASDEDQQIEAQSQSIGGRVSSEGGLSQSQEGETDQLSQTGSQSDNQTGGGQAGSDQNGSGGDNGGNDDSPDDKDPGTGNDPFEGYDGVVPQYNPGDAFSKVNRVDHLAVIGQSAAVMAQAIGGPGALSATTEGAYNGTDDPYGRCRASLGYIFGNELSSCQLLWSGNGSTPGTLSDVDALVEACGKNGVILYDQNLGNQGSFFSLDQRKRLQAANIQMAPVDFSSVEGIKDCARALGQAFANDRERSQRAQDYLDVIDDIVRAVANTHGGGLTGGNGGDSSVSGPVSTYTSCPVGVGAKTYICGYLASAASTGTAYTGGGYHDIDSTSLLLYGDDYFGESPLPFWYQAAGVNFQGSTKMYNKMYNHGPGGLFALSSLSRNYGFVRGNVSGALARWNGSYSSMSVPYTELGWMGGYGSTFHTAAGLGSKWEPYLVVCSYRDATAQAIKSQLIACMNSRAGDNVPNNPYSCVQFSSDRFPIPGVVHGPYSAVQNDVPGIISTFGATGAVAYSGAQNPFLRSSNKLDCGNAIRENPTGLLGDWTEGTMESALEAVWLAELYSKELPGCDYVPLTDMDGFSVNIGGSNCTTTQQTVEAFYRYFYRLSDADANQCYQAVVTDTFAGLN